MVLCLECNIDDLNPELYPYIIERLLEGGARDVWLTPIIMKHGRPGVCLSLLCDGTDIGALEEIVFLETSTLGIRRYPVERRELHRQHVNVTTEYGTLRVKAAFDEGNREVNAAPEHCDCREAAARCGAPLKRVYQAALIAYEKHKNAMK